MFSTLLVPTGEFDQVHEPFETILGRVAFLTVGRVF